MTTNRMALALAVAGGYALGRTRKGKMAIGLGTLLLGRRLKLSPQQLAGMLGEQLKSNPELAGLGEQLRGDLKGVGKAATDAFIIRRMDSLADSLHGRTEAVRGSLGAAGETAGETVKGTAAEGEEAEEEQTEEEQPREAEEAGEGEEADEGGGEDGQPSARRPLKRPQERREPARKAPAKKAPAVKKTAATKPTTRRAAARKPGQPAPSAPQRSPGGERHG